ncbi:MAG: hypothetical protein RJAPGHWK_002783 [Candidatus Fervidibacter sp.]
MPWQANDYPLPDNNIIVSLTPDAGAVGGSALKDSAVH